MLTLLTGRAGSGKTAEVLEHIKSDVKAGKPGSVFIVPEQYSHEAERELARKCPDSASLYAEVMSFTGLARNLFAAHGGNTATYLDDGGKLLGMALSLESFGRELPGLRLLGRNVKKTETQEMLVSAIDELKASGALPGDLRDAAGKLEGILSEKLLDIADIYENYSNTISMSGADSSDILSDAADIIRKQADVSAWRVYIDGFTDFTAGERAIIEALMLRGAEVTVCLTIDPADTGNEVFMLPANTAVKLRTFAETNGIEITEKEIKAESDRADRRRETALLDFAGKMFMYSEKAEFSGSKAVRLFSCSSAHEECELAAALSRELVRKTGCRWRDIAVAARGFSDYEAVMKRVFEHYEVPLFISEKSDVFTRPLPALIYFAYEIACSHWSQESVIGYMRTGLTGLDREECDELENYIFKWQLDERAWRNVGKWRQHPEGFKSSFSPEDNEKLARINDEAIRLAAPLQKFIGRSEECSVAERHAKNLAEFMNDLGLPHLLGKLRMTLVSENKREEAAEYRRLWEITVRALEQCTAVLGNTSMDMEEFGKLFTRMLSKYTLARIPTSLDRVCAGDFDRMRHRNIRHLIVLGASDDRLPGGAETAGIFSENEKEKIRTAGLDLGAGENELWREYTLIYNCLSLPSETLTMSFSAEDSDGNPTKPAYVMMQAKRMFGTDIVKADYDLLRLSATEPAFSLAANSLWLKTAASEAASRVFGEMEPERLEKISAKALVSRGSLSPASVRMLYGDDTRMSASRADIFAKCRFEYFCRFGLNAKPYETAELKANEIGSFVHKVLEKTAAEVMSAGGFRNLDDDRIMEIADKHIDEFFHTELQDFEEKSARFTYLFRRLRSDVHDILKDVAEELRRSDFVPLDFELDINKTEDIGLYELPGDNRGIKLSGIIDRVDGWEHDGKLYLRIVDYKTGKKSFKLDDVCYGLDLQMLIYLNVLRKYGSGRYGKDIVPAGIMYLPARTEYETVTGIGDEAGENPVKPLRRSGFVLDDADVIKAWENEEDQFFIPVTKSGRGGNPPFSKDEVDVLSRWVDKSLERMSDDIEKGDITADPLFEGEGSNACMNCDYKNQCGFVDGENGERKKVRRKMKDEDIWEFLKKAVSEAVCPDEENGGKADA